MSLFGYTFEYTALMLSLFLVIPLFLFFKNKLRKRSIIAYPPVQYKKSKVLPKMLYSFNTALEVLLIIFLFASLAKPYRASDTVMISEEGIDILLLIDISSSMQAKDFEPNRLEATKKIVKEFVRRSGGNRIGITVFAKHVFTLAPLTTDHIIVYPLIDGLSLDSIDHVKSGGTALGDALIRGTDQLVNARIEGRDQIIILLSDGDSNFGVDPALGARYAFEENKIRVHTIGLGSAKDIEVIPDPKHRPNWRFMTKLVETQLRDIATKANGNYYHADSNEILSAIFNEIGRLERSPLETRSIQQRKYLRLPFNIAVATLFISSIILRVLFIRRPLK